MAQFGRALRSGRRGRRFKSCHPDHKSTTDFDVVLLHNRGVAQVVAHLTGGQGAAGSSPVTPTITGVLKGFQVQ